MENYALLDRMRFNPPFRSQAGKFPYENEIQDPQPSEPPQICRNLPPNNLPFQDFPGELLLLDSESNWILDGKFS